MTPGDILIKGGHVWRIEGVYLGALGQQSVVELVSLTETPPATRSPPKIEPHHVGFVDCPERMLVPIRLLGEVEHYTPHPAKPTAAEKLLERMKLFQAVGEPKGELQAGEDDPLVTWWAHVLAGDGVWRWAVVGVEKGGDGSKVWHSGKVIDRRLVGLVCRADAVPDRAMVGAMVDPQPGEANRARAAALQDPKRDTVDAAVHAWSNLREFSQRYWWAIYKGEHAQSLVVITTPNGPLAEEFDMDGVKTSRARFVLLSPLRLPRGSFPDLVS